MTMIPRTPDDYLGLVTSEHRIRPKFAATVRAIVGPLATNLATLLDLPGVFDVDVAHGDQLDRIGEWVGLDRAIAAPITGVYFSWDTAVVGWDQGSWLGPYDVPIGISKLPDDAYRTVLRTVIAANQWDGTRSGAYRVWSIMFPSNVMELHDPGDMTISYVLRGTVGDILIATLFTGAHIDLRPCGVQVTSYTISG